MKRNKTMTLLVAICLVSVIAVLPFIAACAKPAPAPAPAPTSAPAPAPAPAPSPSPLPSPSPTKVWELRWAAGGAAPISPFAQQKDAWAKTVGEVTKGRVKIITFHSNTLCPTEAIWSSVVTGVAGMGQAITGNFPGQFPLTDVITLPFTGGTGELNGRVVWRLYEEFPALQAEYKDVHLMGLFATEAYPLATTKKPVRTLEDLKGLKIRAPGGPPTDMTKALGAVSVPMPMPDVYLALQKGVLDGMWYSHESVLGFKMYEVTKYTTAVPSFAIVFWEVMNKDTWNSFPADIQEQLNSVSGEQIAIHYGSKAFDAMKTSLYSMLKEKDIKWPDEAITLSPEELQRWVEAGGQPVWNAWVEKNKGKGPTQEIINRAIAIAAELSK